MVSAATHRARVAGAKLRAAGASPVGHGVGLLAIEAIGIGVLLTAELTALLGKTYLLGQLTQCRLDLPAVGAHFRLSGCKLRACLQELPGFCHGFLLGMELFLLAEQCVAVKGFEGLARRKTLRVEGFADFSSARHGLLHLLAVLLQHGQLLPLGLGGLFFFFDVLLTCGGILQSQHDGLAVFHPRRIGG
jgi:hypothetical protein